MPAFEIHRRRRQDIAAVYEVCHVDGCHSRTGERGTSGDTGRRTATHVCLMLDRPTFLCAEHARDWGRFYAEALEGSTGIEFQEAA